MITAAELAGFFAAHAVWSLSDSDTFSPVFAYATDENERRMTRLVGQDISQAIELGRKQLARGEDDAADGVLVFDGRISTDDGKMDAIIIEMRSYCFPSARATIAVPYTPRSSGKFLVHRPKVLNWEKCEDFDLETAVDSFFAGVDSHTEGSKVWNAAIDQGK